VVVEPPRRKEAKSNPWIAGSIDSGRFLVEQVDREETSASGHAIAAVIGHRGFMPWWR
jgi:hypothetical protein